jgi:hypothetical protein
VDGFDYLIEMILISRKALAVAFTTTREERRYIGIGDLVFGAGNDAYP